MKSRSIFSVSYQYTSPSMRREWIEMLSNAGDCVVDPSPSMRREWIEIFVDAGWDNTDSVSLHAEGVD